MQEFKMQNCFEADRQKAAISIAPGFAFSEFASKFDLFLYNVNVNVSSHSRVEALLETTDTYLEPFGKLLATINQFEPGRFG